LVEAREETKESSSVMSALTSPISYVVSGLLSSSDETNPAQSSGKYADSSFMLEKPFDSSLSNSILENERRGDRAFATGALSDAIQMYTDGVLNINPAHHVVLCKRGIAYLKRRQYDLCMRDATKCIALRTEWPMGYLFKGICLWRQKQPLLAAASFVCGLCVDPQNTALLRALNLFFAATKSRIIVIDKSDLLRDICEALSVRGMSHSQLDRVAVTSQPHILQELCPLQKITIAYGTSLPLKSSSNVTKSDRAMLADINTEASKCGLRSGDVIVSVNGVSMEEASFDHVKEALESSNSQFEDIKIRVIGLVNRVSSLLSAAKSETEVSEEYIRQQLIKRNAPVIVLDSALHELNGVYIPQESRNHVPVYQNESGYLLSFEKIESSMGWIIGKDGEIHYAKPMESCTSKNASVLRETATNFLTNKHKNWIRLHAGKILTESLNVEYYGNLPVLDSLLSHQSDEADYQPGDDKNDFISQEWSPLLQLVAIKGYGLRAISNGHNPMDMGTAINGDQLKEQKQDILGKQNGYESAMKCFDIVIQRVSVLISIKQHCDTERILLMSVLTNKGRLLLERKRNFRGAVRCLKRARAVGRMISVECYHINVMNDYHLALALSNLGREEQKEALRICLHSIKHIQQSGTNLSALQHFSLLEKSLTSMLNLQPKEDAGRPLGLSLDVARIERTSSSPALSVRPQSPLSQMRKNVVGRSKRLLGGLKKSKRQK